MKKKIQFKEKPEHRIVHKRMRRQVKLVKKIVESGLLSAKERKELIYMAQNNLGGYMKGFDVKYLFKISDKLEALRNFKKKLDEADWLILIGIILIVISGISLLLCRFVFGLW